MSIASNLTKIRQQLPAGDKVTLIAVSKTHPASMVMEAYEAGQQDFGENKVQELLTKADACPKTIRWHLIGHLQTNKVKLIVPFIHLIQSVDTLKLLHEINKQAVKINKVINCLLQVHIATEETKFGFADEEIVSIYQDGRLSQFPNVKIAGLMGMATNTENTAQVRQEFHKLKLLFDKINQDYGAGMTELSMGMSSDYIIAIEEGSTMIRVGSAIFGEREYHKEE